MISPVSICVPTFNGARDIAACLESALAQTWSDFEIVVNDDGSTDDTLSIADGFARRDSRVKVFRNDTHLGLAGSWNRTIELAGSPWIKLLFQDDTLHEACVANLVAMTQSTGLPFVACFRDIAFDDSVSGEIKAWFGEHLAFVRGLFADEAIMLPERVAEICLDHFAFNFVGEPIVTMMHRRVFDELGGFDSTLVQRVDTEYWYRAGLRFGVGMVRRPLATFRFHQQSTSATNLARRKYVDEQIDPLIIRWRCLFDDRYALVRQVAAQRGSLDALKKMLEKTAFHAEMMAYEALAAGDASCWGEWRRAAATYPEIQLAASRAGT